MDEVPTSRKEKPSPETKPAAPLYAQVKQRIRERIETGEWPPRHRVPSENEIVTEFGISRMTANRALRELANEGAITRVQGVGSFVAERKGSSALFKVRSIADEIAERGNRHSSRVILLRAEKAASGDAEQLGVKAGTRIFHSVLVHLENDVPVQIEDRLVNPATAPDYLSQDFGQTTPNAYLTAVAPILRAEQAVEAVLPTEAEADLLTISMTEPCLMMRRRTWSGERSVTAVRLLYPGSRYRLEGHLDPPQS